MKCAWDPVLSILPQWLKTELDRQGREDLLELRLRLDSPPEFVHAAGSRWAGRKITSEDLHFCINTACRYSPWTAASSASGFLTIQGGHRIGLCGEAVCKEGEVTGFREVHSLCIRIARDITGRGSLVNARGRSVLILGAPGWGKTTLLRDYSRIIAQEYTVTVIDERKELFPAGFDRGKRMDVLFGCPKREGIGMAIRTMGPEYIAVDEITAGEDCDAILQAFGCGVNLLATAHGGSLEDFRRNKVYRPLLEAGVFEIAVLLRRDKSFREERIQS